MLTVDERGRGVAPYVSLLSVIVGQPVVRGDTIAEGVGIRDLESLSVTFHRCAPGVHSVSFSFSHYK